MSATIEVVCYKYKVLANNESPSIIRISKDKKRKYSSIGISINPALWDFEKNKPRHHTAIQCYSFFSAGNGTVFFITDMVR
jgi:hypothetical protein